MRRDRGAGVEAPQMWLIRPRGYTEGRKGLDRRVRRLKVEACVSSGEVSGSDALELRLGECER